MIAYAVAGTVLSLIVTVAIMAVGTLILSRRDETTLGVADLADVLWRNLVVAALLGAFGVCVGGIVRNQVVAIVGLLVVAFALEPTLFSPSRPTSGSSARRPARRTASSGSTRSTSGDAALARASRCW